MSSVAFDKARAALGLASRRAHARKTHSPSAMVARNRALTLIALAALWLSLDALFPERAQRDLALTVLTSQLGYAHFAGSFFAARARIKEAAQLGGSLVGWLLAGSTLVTLFVLYTWLAQSQAWLLALLVVSLWHIVENDLALGAAYGARLRMPPMGRSVREQLIPIGWTLIALWLLLAALSPAETIATNAGRPAPLVWRSLEGALLVIALVVSVPAGGSRAPAPRAFGHAGAFALLAFVLPRDVSAWISFEALYALISLYHYGSWLVLLGDRASTRTSSSSSPGAFARLVRWHVVWFAVTGAVIAWPATRELALRLGLLSPALFLFWATLHVAQSHWLRGFVRRY